jgi:hypothetical protein
VIVVIAEGRIHAVDHGRRLSDSPDCRHSKRRQGVGESNSDDAAGRAGDEERGSDLEGEGDAWGD